MFTDKPNTGAVAAFLLATVLLWKPSIVVLIPGFIYTNRLDTVFLSDGCVGYSQLTVFVFCLFEVLIACVLMKKYVFPYLLFPSRLSQKSEMEQKMLTLDNVGDAAAKQSESDTEPHSYLQATNQIDLAEVKRVHLHTQSGSNATESTGHVSQQSVESEFSTDTIDVESAPKIQISDIVQVVRIEENHKTKWESFDQLKQRKLIGTLLKIIVRFSCCVQILSIVSPYVDLQNGLFSQFNVKQAHSELAYQYRLTPCGMGTLHPDVNSTAGMTLHDATSLRAWTFVRNDLMAIMIWELAFIPEISLDIWMHHLFVIFAVIIGSDPMVFGSRSELQPLVDLIAFSLVLGATLAWVVEFCAMRYHFNKHAPLRQAQWMLASLLSQAFLTLLFFLGLPIYIVYLHKDSFGVTFSIVIVVILFLLATVEVKMMVVKRSIAEHARQKELEINS